jgi:hypothetical protein
MYSEILQKKLTISQKNEFLRGIINSLQDGNIDGEVILDEDCVDQDYRDLYPYKKVKWNLILTVE